LAIGGGLIFLVISVLVASRLGTEFLPALEEAISGSERKCRDHLARLGHEATRKMREILLRHPEVITVVSQHGRPTTAPTPRLFQTSNCSCRSSLSTNGRPGSAGKADRRNTKRVRRRYAGIASTSRNIFKTMSRRRFPASRARIRSRSSTQSL